MEKQFALNFKIRQDLPCHKYVQLDGIYYFTMDKAKIIFTDQEGLTSISMDASLSDLISFKTELQKLIAAIQKAKGKEVHYAD